MHPVGLVVLRAGLELRALGVDVDEAHGVAGLEAAGLLDLAAGMIRVVLLGPTEGVGALEVGLAELAAAALGHALDTQRERTITIHIIQAPEAELLGWSATRFDGHGACEGHEVGPAHLVAELQLHFGQEPAGLVQVGVVAPLVLRPVALACALAAPGRMRVVDHAEAPRAVPGQSGKEARVAGHITVLRAICRPVGLRGGHECGDGAVKLLDVQGPQLAVVLRLAQNLSSSLALPPLSLSLARFLSTYDIPSGNLCMSARLGVRAGTTKGGQVLPSRDGAKAVMGEVVAPHLGRHEAKRTSEAAHRDGQGHGLAS